MTEKEIDALVAALAPVIKRHVESAMAPLAGRLAAVEAVQPLQGERGPAGKDADPDAVAALVRAAVAALPAAKDGAEGPQGPAGKDGPSEEQVREIAAQAAFDAVTEKMAGFPPIPKGPPGEPGKDGKDADPEAIIAAVLKAIPVPKDGQPGRDGVDGKDGLDGKDGVGLAGALIDRSGSLVVTLTDGSQKELGPVEGKDGAPGRDGADALGFDDLSIEFDGERSFKFVMSRGEIRKEFGPFSMPVVVDRGVWREGEYKRGDGVTWGGSFWIAQEDTADKPETSKAWRLAVKRGRDGKDGKPPPGNPGPVKV